MSIVFWRPHLLSIGYVCEGSAARKNFYIWVSQRCGLAGLGENFKNEGLLCICKAVTYVSQDS